MSFVSSRSASHASTNTLDHQWDPRQVLGLHLGGRCIGWASTTRDGTCRYPINRSNKRLFDDIVTELSSQPLDATLLRPKLEHLAYRGLCLRNHKDQREDMVREWMRKISDHVRHLAELDAVSRQSRADTRSSTASFATAQSFRTPVSRSAQPPSSTASSTSTPLTVQSEAESLQICITAIQECLERLQTPQTPRTEPSRHVARIPTADISSLNLSNTSNTTLSTASTRSRSSTTSTRSPSPARSTSSRHSASSSSSDSSAPPSTPAQLAHRPQPTFARTMDTSSPDFDPSAPRRRDLDIFGQDIVTSQAPPLATSSRSTPSCTRAHVRRLSISDECPICYSGEPLSTCPASELTWCTSSCGRTVHKACLDKWAAQCRTMNRALTCTVCRAEWARSCACGGLSNCGVVHAARKDLGMRVPCPICKEEMQEGDGLEWCKDGCGQNVHGECMDAWKAHCVGSGRAPSCTLCRAEWRGACDC